jgi:hypothetical protein
MDELRVVTSGGKELGGVHRAVRRVWDASAPQRGAALVRRDGSRQSGGFGAFACEPVPRADRGGRPDTRQAYRDKLAAWHAECAHRARQALLLRLRANTGAAATTGRNYRIWRRYEEGKLSLAAVGKEFGISGRRVGQIVARQREILPLRQKIWAEKRHNLGRPLDIDANQEDYRGKWLYD